MCGRYALAVQPEVVQQAFNLPELPTYQSRYNIAPTQTVPVITNAEPQTLSLLRWGLIPSWAKDTSMAARMINARSETAFEKPSFRNALRRRRCIVPASGFYEWQARSDGKQPYYIRRADQPVFGMAGLWETWQSPEGETIRSFTILTTQANTFMSSLHERMSVILRPEDYPLWLDSADVPPEALTRLFAPFSSDGWQAYEVSRAVNKATVDMPDLILPLTG